MDVYKDWLGIPEGDRPPDHYQLLRLVQFEDDAEKIRNNYRKLNTHVRQYASGKYSIQSQELLNELAKAMLCLTDAHRKREYDEGLGRAFVEEAGEFAQHPMEQILVNQGHISAGQMKEARDFADARGLSNRDAVIQMKLVDASVAQQALAEELGLSYVELAEMIPDDSVLDLIPRNVVKRNRILPLFEDDDRLLVACVDEPDTNIEDEIRLRYNLPMRAVLVTPLSLNQAMSQYYAPGMRDEVKKIVQKKSNTKKKTAKKKTVNKAEKSDQELNAAERKQRYMMGGMFIMWTTIACALLDSLLIPKEFQLTSIFPSCLTLIFPPIVATFVFLVYWKK